MVIGAPAKAPGDASWIKAPATQTAVESNPAPIVSKPAPVIKEQAKPIIA